MEEHYKGVTTLNTGRDSISRGNIRGNIEHK